MRHRLIRAGALLVAAGLAFAATMIAGIPGGIAVLAVIVGGPYVQRWRRLRRWPERCRAMLEEQLTPEWRPPPRTEPVDLPLAGRYAASTGRRELRALFADDLLATVTTDGQALTADEYAQGLVFMRAAYDEIAVTAEEVRSVPDEPDTFLVRFSEVASARTEPGLEAEWWERWEVGAGQRIRKVSWVAVTRVS